MHDAIVIGGGPAGATTALLLARAGWSVAIIEKAGFPRGKVCGEFLSAPNLPLLRELGLAETFLALAGPAIHRIGVFAGDESVTAEMPCFETGDHGWGRALGRAQLDALLLDRAAASGATVWQPCSAIGIRGTPGDFVCTVAASANDTFDLRARVVIAGHGSWEPGSLETQPSRVAARPGDLFGFKARFTGSRLPPGLMPLLAFPGGYGGMVHTDSARVSLSCCIRRDRLEQCRRAQPGSPAGDAVLAHVVRHCSSVGDALHGAALEPNSWHSAGPIRPGIRAIHRAGVFLVGNAAGEAHPVIAEGIGMAMQAAWLLARCLTEGREDEYGREWRRAFSWRIRASGAIAHWAMRPRAVAWTTPLLRVFPRVLTESARMTGKVTPVGAAG